MSRKESILPSAINDKETPEDSLGFAPYVDAVAVFLVNDASKPPLTISIEGEWGSGKSSFMRQLEKRITDIESPVPEDRRPFRVWFNPWRHDKQEELWAAFALEFLAHVRERLPKMRRWRGDWSLFRARFKWKRGLTEFVRKILEFVWWGFVILMLCGLSWNAPALLREVRKAPSKGSAEKTATSKNGGQPSTPEFLPGLRDWEIRSGGFLGTLVLALYLFNFAKKQLANPFKADLQRHLGCPRYEGSASFVEEFHRDFPRILSAYADERRVYVFIDDLDRCEVPRAADLMQAINLMISNDPRIVFVIGMDWDKVAAGMAVKNEALSRYLISERAPLLTRAAADPSSTDNTATARTQHDPNARDSQTESQNAMQIGREFMEKFVQLRFRVPRPSNEDLSRLLLTLSRPAAARKDETGSHRHRAPWGTKILWWRYPPALGSKTPETSKEGVQKAGDAVTQRTSLQELIEFDTSADSDTVQTIALALMPAFDNNPRRLKQFLGLYRLRIYIAKVTGMFAVPKGHSADSVLTLEQLGKFTALELGWPDLLREAQRDAELLARLEDSALSGAAGELYWVQRRGLATIIKAGLDRDESERRQWSLSGLNLSQLLRVSAYVGAFDARIPSASAAPEGAIRPQGESTAQEWFKRGLAAEDRSEKLHCYSQAIRLKPDYVPAYINRGNVRCDLRDAGDPIKDYDKALELQAHHALALYNRGLAYRDRGDVRLALLDYDEAIEFDPNDADAFNNRGIDRVAAGEMRGALEDFDAVIRLRPTDADGHYNRGIARHREHDLDGAIVDYTQAILFRPDDPDAFVNRAIARIQSGDRNGADVDFAEARQLESKPQT